MSLIDKFCMSIESKEDRKLCYQIGEDLEAMITDMGDKGLLRSELKVASYINMKLTFKTILTHAE